MLRRLLKYIINTHNITKINGGLMKKVTVVKEAAAGNSKYYVVKYTDGTSKIVHYLTRELEKHLEE